MGTIGTLLFIPFILLVIGFFVFLFYKVAKSDAQMTRKPRETAKSRATQAAYTETDDRA